LHFEVMRRTAPELVAIPFVNDVWAPKIFADSTIELPREPYPSAIEPPAHALKAWQWRFLQSEGTAIARLFKDADRYTDMGAICDMRKLRRLARHADQVKKKVDAKAVLSAVSLPSRFSGEPSPSWIDPEHVCDQSGQCSPLSTRESHRECTA
jgi:hypothetical protein